MEWNNHPFEKDTPVRTFGSRSELAAWDAENCDRCIKHDECELCDAIMAAYIGDGRVPLWVAKRIGCLYDPLYFVRQSRKHVQGAPDGGGTRFSILTIKTRYNYE